MHDGTDVAAELAAAFEAADSLVEEMAQAGRRLAEREREYRMAKRKRILYERASNKTPVGLIADVVKGYEDISLLALERDCAGAEYEAVKEAIMLNKRKIDWLREQWGREWAQAGDRR